MAETAEFEQKVIIQAVDNLSKEIKAMNEKAIKALEGINTQTAKAQKGFDGMRGSILSAKTALFALSAVATGGIVKAFIAAGSQIEDMTIQFETLLGSADNAKKRMAELSKFAETTPFELGQVSEASKILEVMTGGALSTGKALRMVGDAASITANRDFAGLATWVGRAYSGLKAGAPIGEPMMRLTELGLVTGDARRKIEELQKQGKNAEAWKILEAELGRAAGGMEKLSHTVTGLWSTIKDQLQAGMRQIMESGIWEGFRQTLEKISAKLDEMVRNGTLKKIGDSLGMIARMAKDVIIAMAITKIIAIGKAFDGAALGVLKFDTSMKKLNLNVVIASVTALHLALEAVLSSMEKAVQKKGEADWMNSKEQIERLKIIRGELDKIRANTTKDNWQAQVGQATLLEKEYKKITGWTVQQHNNLGITNESLDAQIELLERQKKVTEEIKKEEDVTAGFATTAKEAGDGSAEATIEGEKLRKVEAEKEKIRKEAEEKSFVSFWEHEEAMTAAQEETRARELELNRLHFEKLAEQEQTGLTATLRRKEEHKAKEAEINRKWDKEDSKRQKELQDKAKATKEKELRIQRERIDAMADYSQMAIDTASNIAQVLGAQGKTFKKFAFAESVIQGIRAFFMALTQFPGPPATVPMAVATGALATSKSAVIASQAFQAGGMPTGRNTMVRVNESGQEGILNARAMSEMGPGELNARNQGIPAAGNTISNQIIYQPTINASGSKTDIIRELEADLPRFANLISETAKRGFMKNSNYNRLVFAQ
jgi:hypothetical protein